MYIPIGHKLNIDVATITVKATTKTPISSNTGDQLIEIIYE